MPVTLFANEGEGDSLKIEKKNENEDINIIAEQSSGNSCIGEQDKTKEEENQDKTNEQTKKLKIKRLASLCKKSI